MKHTHLDMATSVQAVTSIDFAATAETPAHGNLTGKELARRQIEIIATSAVFLSIYLRRRRSFGSCVYGIYYYATPQQSPLDPANTTTHR